MKYISLIFSLIIFSQISYGAITATDPNDNNFIFSLANGQTSTVNITVETDTDGEEIIQERVYGSGLTATNSCVGVLSDPNLTCEAQFTIEANTTGSKRVEYRTSSGQRLRITVVINRIAGDPISTGDYSSVISSDPTGPIDFGLVSDRVYQVIYIRNNGSAPTDTIAPIQMTTAGYLIGSDTCSGSVLGPNSNCRVIVFFDAQGLFGGTYSDQVKIQPISGEVAPFSIDLTAEVPTQPQATLEIDAGFTKIDATTCLSLGGINPSECFYQADLPLSGETSIGSVSCVGEDPTQCSVLISKKLANEPVEFLITINYEDNSVDPLDPANFSHTVDPSEGPPPLNILVGESATETFTVTNTSASALPLPITTTLSGEYSSEGRIINNQCASLSESLPQGGSCTFDIELTPTVVHSSTNTLIHVAAAGNTVAASITYTSLDPNSVFPVNPEITIDGGNLFTSQASVTLTLFAENAEEMKVSEDLSCSSGTWEVYSTSKIISLGSLNQENNFSVSYRNSFGESTCVSSSITHDDIAPVISFDQTEEQAIPVGSYDFGISETENNPSGSYEIEEYTLADCSGSFTTQTISGNTYSVSVGSAETKSIKVKTTDLAGNYSEACSYNVLDIEFAQNRLVVSLVGTGTFLTQVSDDLGKLSLTGQNEYSGDYDDEVVLLTLSIDSNDVFSGWGGDCSSNGTNLTCSLDMTTGNKSVEVNLSNKTTVLSSLLPQYEIKSSSLTNVPVNNWVNMDDVKTRPGSGQKVYIGSTLYFTGPDIDNTFALWKTEGTPATTEKLTSKIDLHSAFFAKVSNKLYFHASHPATGIEFFEYDTDNPVNEPTTSTTAPTCTGGYNPCIIREMNPGSADGVPYLHGSVNISGVGQIDAGSALTLGGKVLFAATAGEQVPFSSSRIIAYLWVYDPSVAINTSTDVCSSGGNPCKITDYADSGWHFEGINDFAVAGDRIVYTLRKSDEVNDVHKFVYYSTSNFYYCTGNPECSLASTKETSPATINLSNGRTYKYGTYRQTAISGDDMESLYSVNTSTLEEKLVDIFPEENEIMNFCILENSSSQLVSIFNEHRVLQVLNKLGSVVDSDFSVNCNNVATLVSDDNNYSETYIQDNEPINGVLNDGVTGTVDQKTVKIGYELKDLFEVNGNQIVVMGKRMLTREAALYTECIDAVNDCQFNDYLGSKIAGISDDGSNDVSIPQNPLQSFTLQYTYFTNIGLYGFDMDMTTPVEAQVYYTVYEVLTGIYYGPFPLNYTPLGFNHSGTATGLKSNYLYRVWGHAITPDGWTATSPPTDLRTAR